MDSWAIVVVASLIAFVALNGIDTWRSVHVSSNYKPISKEKYELPIYKYTERTYRDARTPSMITNEERREVAHRLRETGDELGNATLLWYHISKALGVRTSTDGKNACDMLADLIEPPLQCPYYDNSKHRCSIHNVPAIDRDALLRLVRHMEQIVAETEAHFAFVISTRDVAEYAHKIREALGVKESA